MHNRIAIRLFGLIAPIFTWIINALIPGRRASVQATECRNKCRIMVLVQDRKSYMDEDGKIPLQAIVEKCYALGPFPALWAVEGAGKDLTEWHMARDPNPTRLLIDAPLDPQWNKAQLMLHAGMGLGFAKYHVERLPARPTDKEVWQAVTRTVELCRSNSRPGYGEAAIESLGLVSHFMKNAAYCRRVHEVLSRYAPDLTAFFWRGVGRCLYFHPANFLPGLSRPLRAIRRAELVAPTAEAKEAMISGVAWAMTLVNMTHPEVMEWYLEHDEECFAGNPAFITGVVASVVMRYDTSPDDPHIRRFMQRRPDPAKPALCDLWESRITVSFQTAISVVHPLLKAHSRLDEVFRYQSLAALASSLESLAPKAPAGRAFLPS